MRARSGADARISAGRPTPPGHGRSRAAHAGGAARPSGAADAPGRPRRQDGHAAPPRRGARPLPGTK
ncbi:hypothetical protein DD630_02220 [Streptomyces sp. BSE7F]|nr:hypothetical protein DD630_02220 [Streptomyces sp. BSE7F]